MAKSSFDFVVVGGGPAGSALAAGLAKVPSLKVLLLEAGGNNEHIEHMAACNRYSTFMTAPGYNWKHESIPQPHMANRKLNYDAGKGLGGGTSINFGCYTRGPAQDYERWARVTGDEQMGWKATRERLKEVETMHAPPEELEKYCKPADGAHGYTGPIQVSYDILDAGVKDIVDRGRAFGYDTNLDVNSGNVIGMGASLSSAAKGLRTSAATFLKDKPDNLSVRTQVYVHKVIMDGKKAVGVETADGEKIFATREVILSASALRTPHILLLSGIGPADHLSSHSIPVVHDLPGVGQQFRDHGFTYITLAADPSIEKPAHNLSEEALQQWMIDQTGPLAGNFCPAALAFLKARGIEKSEEFKALNDAQQTQVTEPGRPNWELLSNMPPFVPGLNAAETHTFVVGFMNPLSTGSITLQSANPSDPPVVDPQMLSHPFDRRVAIESIREAMTFLDTLKSTYVVGPEGRDDEAILRYVAANTSSMWHPSSTVSMGAPEDPLTCLDSDFKVKGLEGLRVVDCSAIPLMISAHTQAPAYNIGAAGVQKILGNYGLVSPGGVVSKEVPSSVATKEAPTEAGEYKEAPEGAKGGHTAQDAREGASKPSDVREHNTASTAGQSVKPSVVRRASTWSPFSGVASKLQRRFSTTPKKVPQVARLARSVTNEEVVKPFEDKEEEDESTKAAVAEAPRLPTTEEVPEEAQVLQKIEIEAQKAEVTTVTRRFSVFRAITAKRKAPKVPKRPKFKAIEHFETDALKALEAGLSLVPEIKPHEETKAEDNKAVTQEKVAQSRRSSGAKAETPKAMRASAPKAAQLDTPKVQQAKAPKMEKPGLPKVSKQNVSQVSKNAIYKAMQAGIPKAPQPEALKTMKVEAPRTPTRESPKPQAVHVEAPKVVNAPAVLGSEDNDWCFLA